MSVSSIATFRSKSGPLGFGRALKDDLSGAAAHEFAPRRAGHQAFARLIAKIANLQVEFIPEQAILRLARRVDKSQLALNTNLIDVHHQPGASLYFLAALSTSSPAVLAIDSVSLWI